MTENTVKNIVLKKENINRLIKDIREIKKNPLTDHNIHYIHDEDNILKGYALIIGPKNTPYYGGFYFFNIDYPVNYPYSPPIFKYMTNDGITRFNPNLYINGKVCLSVLNTWYGEQWSSCLTLSTVLLNLCTIFIDNPLTNEPGILSTHPECIKYKKIIEYKNIEVAMLKIINKKINYKKFNLFYDLYIEYVKNNYDDLLIYVKNIFDENKNLRLIETIYKMNITINYKKNLNEFLSLKKELNIN